jgi:tubulin-specific chaperone A
MGPPSQLSIATSVLNRLVKEEKSYHQEAEQQETRIAKLEQGDGSDENAEYTLRQEVCFHIFVHPLIHLYIHSFHHIVISAYHVQSALISSFHPQRKALEETKAMFPPIRQKIQDALARLEQQLVSVLSPPFCETWPLLTQSHPGARQRSRRPEHARGHYEGERGRCVGVDGDSRELVIPRVYENGFGW